MGASASFDTSALEVDPGSEVASTLRVRNNGSVVDEFTFEPLGLAAPWISVEPESLSLFPGDEQQVRVRFAPPRVPDIPPGVTPFAVRVISREDPEGSVAEEGSVTVGRFEQRALELYPPTNRGRTKATYELAVDNRGNSPIDVAIAGQDPENSCRYRFAQDVLRVQPGAATFTKLRVVPNKRFWKGAPKTHQFQVVVTAEEREPELVNATYLQEPLLPAWTAKAAILAVMAAVALFVLWQTLFKSTVESAARDAVAKPLATLTERVDEIAPTTTTILGQEPPVTDASGSTIPGSGDPGATTTVAGGGPGTATTVAGDSDGDGVPDEDDGGVFTTQFGDPTDFQLGIDTPVSAGSSQSFSQDFDKSFALTDVVLQNPGGDAGRVQVSRDGVVLMTSALENFRDYDLHFVAPYVFEEGEALELTVDCTTPGPLNTSGCSVSGSFAGFEK